MISIVDWISEFIAFPTKYEFLLYVAAVSVLLILFIVTLDFFASLFFAIFSRKR